jgi:beta-glucosidase-like glycosyl hydrolase
MFDPPSEVPYTQYGPQNVDTPYARQLALDAARQGIVLLQNNNRVLPFSQTNIKTVALVGPNAGATTTMQGNYYVRHNNLRAC